LFKKTAPTMSRCYYKIGLYLSGLMLSALFTWPYQVDASDGVVNPSAPAKVYAIRKNKRGPYVVFDQGSQTGFVIGRDVCFFDLDNQKKACANIVRTKPRAAAAYITPQDVQLLKPGFYVWPEDLGTIKIQPKISDDLGLADQDMESLISEEDDPPEIILPPLLRPRVQLHLSPTYSLPIWMSDLRFNSSARAAGQGEVWREGDTIRGSVAGFGLRYYIALPGRGDSSVDFTYHFVPQRPVKDNFDLTNANVAVKSAVWSHHYRLRWMKGATWRHTESSDLLLYAGLGYDFMQAKFRAEKTGTDSGGLIDGVIKAHAFELPLILTWQRFWGRSFVSAGADASLPLGVFGVTGSGSLSYDEETADADKSVDAAVNAINVRRGWFSLALQFGLGFVF
jgi:hypothetical protein